jgi:hypothetical protein
MSVVSCSKVLRASALAFERLVVAEVMLVTEDITGTISARTTPIAAIVTMSSTRL